MTVLLPVHNGARFLPEAIESILCQTFRDFEFLIIDDGSSDDSCAIVRRYRDRRIRLVTHTTNQGIAAALSKGFRYARGKYIARMDCDDISVRTRLKKQYDFMESHPGVGVCGTWIDCFGDLRARWKYPLTHQEIVGRMLFCSPIGHPTALFRRQVLVDHRVSYTEQFPCAEDYELWSRLCLLTQFANLGEVLYRYRRHHAQLVARERVRQAESAGRIQRRLFEQIGICATEDELRLHAGAVRGGLVASRDNLDRLSEWFAKIVRSNQRTDHYPREILMADVLHYWWKACWLLSGGMETLSVFTDAEIYRTAPGRQRWPKAVLLGVKNVLSSTGRALR